MKKCPECSATYNDDMSFCLNDGASLVSPTEPDIPATVMFNPAQTPPSGQNQPTAPPVFSNAPQQSYQQPQFGQPQFGQSPPFNQQIPGTPPQSGGNKAIIGIIAAAVVVFLGIIGIVGGLMLYKRSNTTPNVYVSNTPTSTPKSSPTPAPYSQDIAQGDSKNGFKKISTEDVTSRNFFPSANKTEAATYEKGSERVVSFVSVYDTPADAEAAYKKVLDQVIKEGKTITTRNSEYAYYNKGSSYSTLFWVSNKLYEYSTNNQQTLYSFAK